MGKTLVGVLIVVLTALAVVAPANAGKPKPGSWFSTPVDPDDEDNLSSIQFNVAKSGKTLKKVTIYWRCRNLSGYHNFTNPPIPIGIDKKKKFELVGATTPPAGQSTKDFTLKGGFTSGKEARYSMQLEGCGPKTKGTLTPAAS
jgi:hypothetical protein